MNRPIYSSNSENGLLRFTGPYRILTSDQSLFGATFLQEIVVPTILLQTQTVGQTTIIHHSSNDISNSEESLLEKAGSEQT